MQRVRQGVGRVLCFVLCTLQLKELEFAEELCRGSCVVGVVRLWAVVQVDISMSGGIEGGILKGEGDVCILRIGHVVEAVVAVAAGGGHWEVGRRGRLHRQCGRGGAWRRCSGIGTGMGRWQDRCGEWGSAVGAQYHTGLRVSVIGVTMEY